MQKIAIIITGIFLSLSLLHENVGAKQENAALPLCQTKRDMRGELRRIKRNLPQKCSIKISKNDSVVQNRNSSISSSVMGKTKIITLDAEENNALQSGYSILGIDHPMIAGFSLFLEQEPIDIQKISVRLSGSAQSVESIRLYNESRVFLGTASRRASTEFSTLFTLDLPSSIHVRQNTSMNMYARLNSRSFENGGVSGEDVLVDQVIVEGNGSWSNEKYTKIGENLRFPTITLARAAIEKITAQKDATHSLFSGSNQLIGHWTLSARKGDARSMPRLQQIVWQLSKSGVSLSNPRLFVSGNDQSMPCTVDSVSITCSLFNDYPWIGAMDDGQTDILLKADITDLGETSAFLSINASTGTNRSDGGDIGWTDGSTNFSWIAIDGGSMGNTLRR